jgi:citrate lyase beta subunit
LATLATKIAFEDDLIPLIETPRAVATVDEIASFKGVRGLFFGAADFSAGLKAKLAWEPLLYARSKVAIAAAMYDLFTIDAPFFFLDDPEGCEKEAIAVKNMGFTGKACIHPSQVDIINKAFEPTKEEKEEAMKVLKEYEKIGGSGVIKVDGKMVDEPIAEAMRLRLELGEDND